MSSGDPTGKHGVALIVTPEVANRIEDFKPINNRMAHMTVNFGREKAIFMILYVPQQGRTDEKKEEFFGNVQTEIDNIKSNKKVIVMGDIIGNQGIGESNAEGKRIVDFWVRNNLAVMNTYYQHKEAHKWTWHGWNSNSYKRNIIMTSGHRPTCSYLL